MPHPKFAVIRRLYRHSCGYCLITETDVGSEMTVDHFKPRAVSGSDELDNLVYACWKCNQFKHDFWPSTDDLDNGRRVLHPLLDDTSLHIRTNQQTGKLEAVTDTGHFHIALLRLNHPQLIKHRLSAQLQQVLHEKNQLLELQVRELERTIKAQEQYLAALHAQIKQLRSES